jgi:hypothetical protein
LNRIQKHIRLGGAQTSGSGKRAEHADGAHAGAASHFDVLSCVANVHAMLGSAAEPLQRQQQRGGMGLAFGSVLAANTCRKIACKFELAELTANALAISTCDDAKIKFLSQETEDAARAWEQRRIFEFVGAGPEAAGLHPFGTREQGCTVNAQPIGGIVQREFALGPMDAQGVKHGEIGAEIGLVGIQQRAIPIEQDRAGGEMSDFHGEGIVSDGGDWEK